MRVSDEALRISAWAGVFGMATGGSVVGGGVYMFGADAVTKLIFGRSPEGVDDLALYTIYGGAGLTVASLVLGVLAVYFGSRRGLV